MSHLMSRRTLLFLACSLGCLPTFGCGGSESNTAEPPKDVAATREEVEARLRNPYNTPEKAPTKKASAK